MPYEVIVHYALRNLPRDYKIVRRMPMDNFVLPSSEEMESILLSEKITIDLISEEKARESLVIQRDRFYNMILSRIIDVKNSNMSSYNNIGFCRALFLRRNQFPFYSFQVEL